MSLLKELSLKGICQGLGFREFCQTLNYKEGEMAKPHFTPMQMERKTGADVRISKCETSMWTLHAGS